MWVDLLSRTENHIASAETPKVIQQHVSPSQAAHLRLDKTTEYWKNSSDMTWESGVKVTWVVRHPCRLQIVVSNLGSYSKCLELPLTL